MADHKRSKTSSGNIFPPVPQDGKNKNEDQVFLLQTDVMQNDLDREDKDQGPLHQETFQRDSCNKVTKNNPSLVDIAPETEFAEPSSPVKLDIDKTIDCLGEMLKYFMELKNSPCTDSTNKFKGLQKVSALNEISSASIKSEKSEARKCVTEPPFQPPYFGKNITSKNIENSRKAPADCSEMQVSNNSFGSYHARKEQRSSPQLCFGKSSVDMSKPVEDTQEDKFSSKRRKKIPNKKQQMQKEEVKSNDEQLEQNSKYANNDGGNLPNNVADNRGSQWISNRSSNPGNIGYRNPSFRFKKSNLRRGYGNNKPSTSASSNSACNSTDIVQNNFQRNQRFVPLVGLNTPSGTLENSEQHSSSFIQFSGSNSTSRLAVNSFSSSQRNYSLNVQEKTQGYYTRELDISENQISGVAQGETRDSDEWTWLSSDNPQNAPTNVFLLDNHSTEVVFSSHLPQMEPSFLYEPNNNSWPYTIPRPLYGNSFFVQSVPVLMQYPAVVYNQYVSSTNQSWNTVAQFPPDNLNF